MTIPVFKTLFVKDLQKLKNEIELYQSEASIWQTEKAIANSAGNLCLHLVGNLNTFIGAVLAKTDYVRHRELEFSLKNIPKAELIKKIEETIPVVEKGLDQLTEQQLQDDYPLVIWDKAYSYIYTLTYLLAHLNYHLGQVNYHRRLLDV